MAGNAKRVVEMGTSTGESAMRLALAIRSTNGHIDTHEIDEG
jgi:predicted O-methyltransferase YrrM